MIQFNEAKERISKHTNKIIDALREAGSSGLTTIELDKIATLRGSKMTFLYMEGYKVKVDSISDGVYRYTLLEEPKTPLPRYYEKGYQTGFDLLSKEIESKHNGSITIDQLKTILDKANLNISRRKGYFKN